MSTLARSGVALGVVLGLVPLFPASYGDFSSEFFAFFALILGSALIPYFVFARVERTWSRPLAITVLAVLATAHVALTVDILRSLDEDALNSIGFLTIPPLLSAAVGVVGIAVALARALAARVR